MFRNPFRVSIKSFKPKGNLLWYDWSFLITLLEQWFRYCEYKYSKHSVNKHPEGIIKDMKLCKNLCKRIGEGYDTPGYKGLEYDLNSSSSEKRDIILRQMKYEEYMLKQDIELLTKTINKKLRTWWD